MKPQIRSLLYTVFILCAVSPVSSYALHPPSIEVAFSPGKAAESIITVISEAKNTIRVAAYSFTSKSIAEALVQAHRRGVDVRVVLDKSNAIAKYSSATFLSNMGIPTRINHRYAIMHNKFMVIDDRITETGSFNYSKAAELKNAENVIILRDNSAIALEYNNEWKRLWNESEDYIQNR